MFKNIGKKIKTLAKIVCCLGIILFVFLGFLVSMNYFQQKMVLFGIFSFLIYAILGSLFSWIGSFCLYAFGELVDNSKTVVDLQKENLRIQHMLLKNTKNTYQSNKKWRCAKCGSEVSAEYKSCPFCEYVEKKKHLKEKNNTI